MIKAFGTAALSSHSTAVIVTLRDFQGAWGGRKWGGAAEGLRKEELWNLGRKFIGVIEGLSGCLEPPRGPCDWTTWRSLAFYKFHIIEQLTEHGFGPLRWVLQYCKGASSRGHQALTLPPGNSQSPAIAFPSGRWASRTLPRLSRRATADTRTSLRGAGEGHPNTPCLVSPSAPPRALGAVVDIPPGLFRGAIPLPNDGKDLG